MQIGLASHSVVEERMQRGIHLLHFYERIEKMDYIEQAHSLTNDEKAQALLIYTQCIKEFLSWSMQFLEMNWLPFLLSIRTLIQESLTKICPNLLVTTLAC